MRGCAGWAFVGEFRAEHTPNTYCSRSTYDVRYAVEGTCFARRGSKWCACCAVGWMNSTIVLWYCSVVLGEQEGREAVYLPPPLLQHLRRRTAKHQLHSESVRDMQPRSARPALHCVVSCPPCPPIVRCDLGRGEAVAGQSHQHSPAVHGE